MASLPWLKADGDADEEERSHLSFSFRDGLGRSADDGAVWHLQLPAVQQPRRQAGLSAAGQTAVQAGSALAQEARTPHRGRVRSRGQPLRGCRVRCSERWK